jgi:hypothetical protein
MKRQSNTTKGGWLALFGIAAAVPVVCANPTVHAQSVNPYSGGLTAPCYAQLLGNLTFVHNGTLVSCVRTIQGAESGQVRYGRWGSTEVHVDASGNIYVKGQPVGVARNPSSAVSGLSSRCPQNDIQACNESERQSEDASRRMPQESSFPKRNPVMGIIGCVLFFFVAVRAIVLLAMAGDWPNVILMAALIVMTVYIPWSWYRSLRAAQASESTCFDHSSHT